MAGNCRAGRSAHHPQRPTFRRRIVPRDRGGEILRPRGKDEQTPHTRDELWVVAQGSGTFANGDDQHTFSAGDVLFVRAGAPHRLEDFTEAFGTWVIFYDPEGGERPR